LQSVVYAGRHGDLRSLIANADAINVDIPSRDGLQGSVCRLEAAGLVHVDGLRVRASRSGRLIVRRARVHSRGIRSVAPRIHERLQQEVAFPTALTDWTLDQATWQDAYDRYYPPEERPR
jgi:hypothetical protein